MTIHNRSDTKREGGGGTLRRLTRAVAGGHQDVPGARGDVHPGLLVVTTEPNESMLRAVSGNLAAAFVLSSHVNAFEPSSGAGIKSTLEPQKLRPAFGVTPKQKRYSARFYQKIANNCPKHTLNNKTHEKKSRKKSWFVRR